MNVWSDGFSVIVDKQNLEEILFGHNALFLEGAFLRSFTISAVRMFKKPCVIELKMDIFCSKNYLIEIVL